MDIEERWVWEMGEEEGCQARRELGGDGRWGPGASPYPPLNLSPSPPRPPTSPAPHPSF